MLGFCDSCRKVYTGALWRLGTTGRHPPASQTGPEASYNTWDILGHVFGHQAPLTRPLEAVAAPCSTSKREGAKWREAGPITRGADPESKIFGKMKKHRLSK